MAAPTPAVTVLMPVRNGALYVRAALASMLAQTLEDFELLVVDDGSSDSTPLILAGMVRSDPRLKVLTLPEPAGLVAALNTGVREARSGLIARMDADDLAHPERLERQLDALDAQPEVVAVGSQIDTFGTMIRHLDYPVGTAQARAYMLFACPFKHPAVTYRRRAVLEVGGYRQQDFPSEDYGLWVRLSQRGDLLNLPQTLLRYRLHPASITASRRDAMQVSNRQVLRSALALVGVEVTEPELASHELLGLAAFDPVPVSAAQMSAASAWAGRLRDANAGSRMVAEEALAIEIERRLGHLQVI